MSTATTDRIPTDKECIDLLWDAGCKKRVVVHCATVRAVAEAMASGIPQADMKTVIAGALLHDIGRSKDHSIMHACIGAKIVEDHKLSPVLVDIVRKHTGAGLDETDVAEMGLPPGDYMPATLEEKIVAHADNLVSDNRVVTHRHSVDKLMAKGADRGALRIELLHQELSKLYGEDLDCMVDVVGEYPKLKHVKP